jgi:hypothetical protein
MDEYYTAAVCRRGHIASEMADVKPVAPHSPTCGAKVLTTCGTCGKRIRGPLRISMSTR